IRRIIATGSKHQKCACREQCPPNLHHPTSSVSPLPGFHDVTAAQSRRATEKGGRSLPFRFMSAGFYVPCGAGGTPIGPSPLGLPVTGTEEVGPSTGCTVSPRSRTGGSPFSRF